MGYFTMRLQDAINETHKRIPDTLEQFSELIDPDWIQQALEYTGKASIRRRKLPAEHVVWIVIGQLYIETVPSGISQSKCGLI